MKLVSKRCFVAQFILLVCIENSFALIHPANTKVLPIPFSKTLEKLARGNSDLNGSASQFSAADEKNLHAIVFDLGQAINARWRALIIGSTINASEFKDDLKKASRSPEWFLRLAALEASRAISEGEARLLARTMLKDKALVVRSAAVDHLKYSPNDQDRDLLWSVIDSSQNSRKGQSLWIRAQALEILAQAPRKTESLQFAKILRDNDDKLHTIALVALEKTSDVAGFSSESQSLKERRQVWLRWLDKMEHTKTL